MKRASRNISALEILARRICWIEFGMLHMNSRKIGATEPGYWDNLPPETREKYLVETRRYLWLAERLGDNSSSLDIVDRARMEMLQESHK